MEKKQMKYVLVTGAYGGMGLAACKMLAKNGYGVFALDKKVKEQTDGIFPIEADVTNEESLKRSNRPRRNCSVSFILRASIGSTR